MKNWKQYYKQFRSMQHKGSEVMEYFQTLWQQNGNNMVKTMVRQSLSAGVSAAGLTSSGSGGSGLDNGGGKGLGGSPGEKFRLLVQATLSDRKVIDC